MKRRAQSRRTARRRLASDSDVRRQMARFELTEKKIAELSVEERLRRVLDFIASDLPRLTSEQREEWVWNLRAIGVLGASRELTEPAHRNLWDADSTPNLQDLQKTIADGLKEVLQKPPLDDNKKVGEEASPARCVAVRIWYLPRPRHAELESSYDRVAKRHFFRVRWEGDEQDAIVEGIWNLLLEVGAHFRACAECNKPFVVRQRQEYCSLECAQRTRNRRKAERRSNKT